MSSDQFRDEPRTYAEIIREAAVRNSHFFWASIALVTGFILFILIAFLVHAHLTEISFVGGAEEQAGQKITDNPMEYYYLSFVIYTAMFLAAFYEYLKSRGDRGV